MNKLIKINTLVNLISENPQEQLLNVLTGDVLLKQAGHTTGVLSLSPIASGTSEENTPEESFLINGEMLSSSCNTILLFSDSPFDLLINNGPIHRHTYHFVLTSDKYFSVSIANRSEINSVKIRYLIAVTESLGSSYVYT
jgi:hypothetical protein